MQHAHRNQLTFATLIFKLNILKAQKTEKSTPQNTHEHNSKHKRIHLKNLNCCASASQKMTIIRKQQMWTITDPLPNRKTTSTRRLNLKWNKKRGSSEIRSCKKQFNGLLKKVIGNAIQKEACRKWRDHSECLTSF